jgi:FkbM family methyltransferase
MKTLIYVGAHVGGGLSTYVNQYDRIFAFEANPRFVDTLRRRFSACANVEVINAAVFDRHEEVVKFMISKNNGDSSSILRPNKDNSLHDVILGSEEIFVKTVSMDRFLEERKIDCVDSYISDLQGCDFMVLRTMKNLIDQKKIGTIQCEVGRRNTVPIYNNPDTTTANTEENFDSLLSKTYDRISTGWGSLQDGVFAEVPPTWSEWDIKWRAKTS